MTRLPYHDLPPDPTGRLPRGIGWKVSPSGRLRQRLGVSQRAVHKRLERIKTHLRQQLEK